MRKFPTLTLVIDHLGMVAPPTFRLSEGLLASLPQLLDLASHPTVSVKFSGVPSLSTSGYPFPHLWPNLHRVIDAFEPRRVMWGSDYTRVIGRHVHPRMDGGRLNYSELVNFVRYSDELGEAEKRWLFADATRHCF